VTILKTREVPAVGDYENPTVTDLATISLRPSPAEVAVDRLPELLGEVERLRAVLRATDDTEQPKSASAGRAVG